jgi:hypothetical protein
MGLDLLDDDAPRWAAISELVLRSGFYEAEMRLLLGRGDRLLVREARRLAPRVTEVITWNPAWRDSDHVLVPVAVFEDGLSSAALEIPTTRARWIEEREEVGRRAEGYTLRLAYVMNGARHVLHASREGGDGLGYDIEVTFPSRRFIEAKGSRSEKIVFVMSRNELATAEKAGPAYEIHFWGGIDLTKSPVDEFPNLVRQGWPTVIKDPSRRLRDEKWMQTCAAWEFRWHDGDVEATGGE